MTDNSGPERAFSYRNVHWLWLSALVLISDQISKQLVAKHMALYDSIALAPMLNLTRLHNTGAAFSILSNAAPLFFVLLAVGVSVGIIIWLRRNPDHDRLVAAALALVAGGALGNAIDRATRGYVVDFVDVHAMGWHWPAFNVADSAIVLGAGLLLLDMWLKRGQS